MNQHSPTRRQLLAAAAGSAGALGLLSFAREARADESAAAAAHSGAASVEEGEMLAPSSSAFPQLEASLASAVVGASHFNFERVEELVVARPELAVATWDWGFGDFESALGAASHVGRPDIAKFLMAHGARPDIFTLAMLGRVDALRAILRADPGMAYIAGPHGIPLLAHAEAGSEFEGLSSEATGAVAATIDYLRGVQGAAGPLDIVALSPEEQAIYVGRYAYGADEAQAAVVAVNRRGVLTLAAGRPNGAPMECLEPGLFRLAGARSLRIQFGMEEGKATSLSILNPEPTLRAKRVE